MEKELAAYLEAIRNAYRNRYQSPAMADKIRDEMTKEFCDSVRATTGRNYIKVIANGSVHSFIVIKDGSKFKMGDILMAASFNAPATNFSRGSIFDTKRIETVRWTGV